MNATNLFKKCNSATNLRDALLKERIFLVSLIILLVFILFFSLIVAVVFGPVSIEAYDVYRIIIYNSFKIGIGDMSTLTEGVSYDIIWHIRFPRVLMGAVIGMGLAIVGVAMQAMIQNPLADPYILGVSSGATLGATLAIMLGIGSFLGANAIGVTAFIGAFAASIVVYTLANIGGRSSTLKLLLAGIAIGAVCLSFSNFIVFYANDAEGIKTLTFWIMGSLVSASWDNIVLPGIVTLAGVLFFIFQFRNMNLMLMGDESAIALGVDLHFWRKVYMLITSLMIGMVVSVAGIIGFVGLIIPHIVRLLVGTDHRNLVPISALIGAIFLIWTDVFARTLMGGEEIPIGILTSMLGAPFFVWLLLKKSYEFGGS